MKTRLLLGVLLLGFITSVQGQKAKDVLEDAVGMKNSQYLLFTKSDIKDTENKVIEYEILGADKIGVLNDSIIFLVKGKLVKTYMTPLNPLNYSFEGKNELLPDKIDADAANALKEIITYVKDKSQQKNLTELDNGIKRNAYLILLPTEKKQDCSSDFDKLNTLLEEIKTELAKDYKKGISDTFQKLKDLDFMNKDKTKEKIDLAKKEFDTYVAHYKNIDTTIVELKSEVNKFKCGDDDYIFLIKTSFIQTVKDLIAVKKEQYKRVENLNLALKTVETTYEAAVSNKKCDWCIEIKPYTILEKGKIASYTFSLKKGGYRLATKADKDSSVDEIIAEDSKAVVHRVFYFRKFRRFIPEVSSGIAYTNLDFPKFGAVTDDATGELKVAKIGEDNIKRINITAMINYNYYVDDSDIHPFIQLGAGINTDFPTLFLGTGLRFNAFNGGRFAISVGFAGSWIKTLGSLNVGDVVQDESDVERDITYEFAKPKLYYGIQFNF